MNEYESGQEESSAPQVRELSKPQRRVLGVLVEKGFTTPEYYPLTLKAATSGCNQKSNRAPVTSYSEDAVLDALDELRELGLAVVVHTESGRTERYRHLVRKRFPFTEPQLAVMTELFLRGGQQLGELRARASRMVPIDGLEELRSALSGLIEQGFVRASGPLERRGVEVDHTFYPASERQRLEPAHATPGEQEAAHEAPSPPTRQQPGEAADLSREFSELRQENLELRSELETLREIVDHLKEDFEELRRNLGA